MAMLAGPRQKKRYCLTPRGKPLFEDNDRFGTKMLEKMGWSKGKGLGKNENGNQEFVRLKYKSDEQGLGFEERDDQWTEHEKQFNGLLENLNGSNNGGDNNSDENIDEARPVLGGTPTTNETKKKLKDRISGQSLEEKSKNSKARVHYKKFTRGKDISQYNEKDLANIFGKKATPDETNIYSQFQAFNANDNENEEDKANERKDGESGTQIINTGVSVTDYFKEKMEKIKAKLGAKSIDGSTRIVDGVEVVIPSSNKRTAVEDDENNDEEEVPRKKKKNKYLTEVTVECEEQNQETLLPRKKKKNKKSTNEVESENIVETSESLENEEPSKKKKKNKKKQQELEDSTINDTEINLKESKSNKNSSEEVSNKESIETTANEIPKKKKKKNKKEPIIDDDSEKHQSSVQTENTNEPTSILQEAPDSNETSITKKKKKKDKKTHKEEVSSHSQDALSNNDNFLLDSLTISTFCAEKFRNLVLQKYQGSNLEHINGYGLSEKLELKVKEIPSDSERIARLWNGTTDKYTHGNTKLKLYNTYMNKAKMARSAKQRLPAFKLKALKRKQVFQGL